MAAKIVMYRTPWCPYCVRAEQLLRQKGVAFEQIDVSGDHERRLWLRQASGQSTVPQIFIDDAPIGGCDELMALEHSGQLDALLGER